MNASLDIRLAATCCIAIACGGSVNAATPPQYVLDFSALPNGGAAAGLQQDMTIAFDLTERVVRFQPGPGLHPDGTGWIAPNVLVEQVQSGECAPGLETQLSNAMSGFVVGQAVGVDHIDLQTLIPLLPDGGASEVPTSTDSVSLCFGVRTAIDGVWHWSLNPMSGSWDSNTSRYRARLNVLEPRPIDAVRIMFGRSGGFRMTERVTIVQRL